MENETSRMVSNVGNIITIVWKYFKYDISHGDYYDVCNLASVIC